jgi:UDP-N-acetyl-D-galactosamine dehydrogenase
MILQQKLNDKSLRICIIGLGYVGLPLAIEFGKLFKTIGFDINTKRINELKEFKDHTLEVEEKELREAVHLEYTDRTEDLKNIDVFIVTVPTPVDKFNRPDLTPLIKASQTVGKCVQKGSVVIYESTVYPGCTEEDCIPIIEKESGLKFNVDFFAGYSPERINPGDKEHRVSTIKKVTSGSSPEIADFVDNLYKQIVKVGTHKAPSIKVAEAAKVIENTQRDINIAFVNELAKLFDAMNIDTLSVLEAAGTKWNFLPFRPGLVGGHCIGVDPYYLTHKAASLGFHPEIMLAGRRINDGMGQFVAHKAIKLMIKKDISIFGAKVLILGITFKENCPDIRNTRVIDIVKELKDFDCDVEIFDPWASPEEVKEEYDLETVAKLDESKKYDAIILAVAHKQFKELNIKNLLKQKSVVYDVKGILPIELVDGRL